MKKGIGFYFSVISCLLAVALLVLMYMYKEKGGIVETYAMYAVIGAIVCEISLWLGEKPWTDFTSVIGVVLLAYAMMRVLADGIWNIAESLNGIKMFGIPELAPMNYNMAAIACAAILFGIFACFGRKSKPAA